MKRALHKKIALALFIAMAIALPCVFLLQGTAKSLSMGVIFLAVGYSGFFGAIQGLELGTIVGGSGYRPVPRYDEPIKFWLTFAVFILFGLAATMFAIFVFGFVFFSLVGLR